MKSALVAGLFLLTLAVIAAQAPELPHLRKQGTATQLVVDGKPFLIRGGELGNSSASNVDYLAPHWETFQALHLNTIVAPVYWDLMEPAEGRFDFALVDGLISQARAHDMRLVLLWFGSWKNSMSCYARLDQDGREALSTQCRCEWAHRGDAFAVLDHQSRHRRAGVCGADEASARKRWRQAHGADGAGRERDWHDPQRARSQRSGQQAVRLRRADGIDVVPRLARRRAGAGIANHLDGRRRKARRHLDGSLWRWRGRRRDLHGLALCALHTAGRGSGEGGVCVADVRQCRADPRRVSARPISSAGPLPHLIDVWRAGAPAIDFLAPDIYFQPLSSGRVATPAAGIRCSFRKRCAARRRR